MPSVMTLTFRVGQHKARWQPGAITRLLPVADEKSRNQTAVVELPESSAGLTDGLPAEARVVLKVDENALLVNKDALTRFGDGWVVFTVKKNRAVPVPVEVIAEHEKKVSVRGNLKPEEPVVVVGNEALFPNARVRVVGPPPPRVAEKARKP